ncbi:hypothetical protein FGG08_000100 [Glutinoglossum americanum]|uniref:GAT domain-containing protein n=1 Tax=Glutinoglossum americanum TaxID=1670608 RepID=A0A9P8IIN4_9PEZI|nr:hypothetical protein FGG08_000100 [Glutinoglossum americanum]
MATAASTELYWKHIDFERDSLRVIRDGEEVLYLPTIVEAAESSPSAAKEAASVIRKFLSKENYDRPHVQYNGVMLVRILVDNPGRTFTRNMDAKFVGTVKDLLKQGKDLSVQQILRDALDAFEKDKKDDENLAPILEMWVKEKKAMEKMYGGPGGTLVPRTLNAPPFDPRYQAQQQNYFARNHKQRGLPPPPELAGRIEEAKTSAKLLSQVVQSTLPSEVLGNELIKEFADRCLSASRSIQGYINAEDPAPDDDTLLTLIETNDQLSLAMSKHQRAVLQARKALASQANPSPTQEPNKEENPFADGNEPQSSQLDQRWQQGPTQQPYDGGYQGYSGYQDRPLGQPRGLNMTMRGARQTRSEDEPVSPVVSLSDKKP